MLSAQLFLGVSGFLLAQPDVAKPPILLATSDGGERFMRRFLPRKRTVGGTVRFASPQVGFAAWDEAVRLADDGRRHWRFVPMPTYLYAFVPIASMGTDPSGDLWLFVANNRAGGSTTPQEIWIRHPDGAWEEERSPGVALPFDTTGEPLDVYFLRRAWLVPR